MTPTEELEHLRQQVRELKGGGLSWPSEWRLTPRQTEYLRLLATRELVSKDTLRTAIYSDVDDPPVDNVFAFHMGNLRIKLRATAATKDIIIRNQPRRGWYLSAGDRGKIKMLAIGFRVIL